MSADYAISLGSAGPGGFIRADGVIATRGALNPVLQVQILFCLPRVRNTHGIISFPLLRFFYPFFRGGGILLL